MDKIDKNWQFNVFIIYILTKLIKWILVIYALNEKIIKIRFLYLYGRIKAWIQLKWFTNDVDRFRWIIRIINKIKVKVKLIIKLLFFYNKIYKWILD